MCAQSRLLNSNNIEKACLVVLFLWILPSLIAQDVGVAVDKTVTLSEWNVVAFVNTSGGGAGFQYGWTP
ncbi:MAG: hypothetical protein LBL18_03670, partial [Bacteroidales bacterium]|nr:hypothetical protein [Bacteroidales bacterium]